MQVPESAYRTGSWFAGVTGACAVLVEDSLASDRVSDLWRQMSQGAPLEQLIDVISGGRFAGIPSFAMAAIVPDGLRIIVRRGATGTGRCPRFQDGFVCDSHGGAGPLESVR
jgi:hypothetical protein